MRSRVKASRATPHDFLVALDAQIYDIENGVNSSSHITSERDIGLTTKPRRKLVRGGRSTPIDLDNPLHDEIDELESHDVVSSYDTNQINSIVSSSGFDIAPELISQIKSLKPDELIPFLEKVLSPDSFNDFISNLKESILSSRDVNANAGPQTVDDLIGLATQFNLGYDYDDAGNLVVREDTEDSDLQGFLDASSKNPSFICEDYDGEYGVGFKGVQGVTNVMAATLDTDSDYINKLAEETIDWIANLGYQATYQIQPDENYLYFEVFESFGSNEVIETYLQPIADITPVPDDLYDDAKTLAEAIIRDLPVEFADNEGSSLDHSEADYDKLGDTVNESTHINSLGIPNNPNDKTWTYNGFTVRQGYVVDNGESEMEDDSFYFNIADANGYDVDLGASGCIDGGGNLLFDMWDDEAVKEVIDGFIAEGYTIEDDFDIGVDHYGYNE